MHFSFSSKEKNNQSINVIFISPKTSENNLNNYSNSDQINELLSRHIGKNLFQT